MSERAMSARWARSVASAVGRFIARFDDRANPIVVKQLRQAVRAKYISGLLVFFLLVQLVVMASIVLGRSGYGLATGVGRQAFEALYVILVAACAVFVPLYVAIQLFMQRTAADVDLFALTTLRPRSVVWGRLLSGMLLSLLIHSAFAPFLTMSYLLRGIDLSVIIVLLVLGFTASVVMIAFSIFLACIPGSRQIRLVFGLLILGGGVMAVVGAVVAARLLTGSGWLSMPLAEFWDLFAVFMVSALLFIGLCFVLSVALVSPRAANRALPVRIYLTALWFLSLVLVVYWGMAVEEEQPLDPWLYASAGLFSFCILFAAGERDTWGPRVARTIPRTRRKRALAFLFYSGSAGGIVWATIMLALTLAMRTLWHLAIPFDWLWHPHTGEYTALVTPMVGVGAFAVAYAATAVALRRAFVPARSTTWAWALIILVVAGSLVPIFIGSLVIGQTYKYVALDPLYTLTPIALTSGYEDYRVEAVAIALVWAVIAGAVCRPWFVGQLRAFRRLEPTAHGEPVDEAESSLPEPVVEDSS